MPTDYYSTSDRSGSFYAELRPKHAVSHPPDKKWYLSCDIAYLEAMEAAGYKIQIPKREAFLELYGGDV